MKLFEVDSSSQYWVVRAGKKARHYRHFIESGCVALGHMDMVKFEHEGLISENDLDEIVSQIYDYNNQLDEGEREESRQLSARIGQISHFIKDFNIGDTVFTLSKERISVGTIVSEPYISKEPIKYVTKQGSLNEATEKFMLRRDVKWESAPLRSSLPAPILTSLGSQKTLFSLEAHEELLKHWLYGMYIEDGYLHFSTAIAQRSDIGQFHLAEFHRIIQKLEALSRIEKIDECTLEDIDSIYYEFGRKELYTLSNKSAFTSPGFSWGKIKAPRKILYAFAFLLGGCMGEPVVLDSNEDSQQVELRQDEFNHAVEFINETTTLEAHKEHLLATMAKPNKGDFKPGEEDISKIEGQAKIKPFEKTEPILEGNLSDVEVGDEYSDFPDIAEEGDTGV